MTANVVSLAGFHAHSKLETQKSERVWDRLIRLCDILTSGTIHDTIEHSRIWDDAVEALRQYIENEWPVEKDNKVRATEVADKAAYLFVSGVFGGLSKKAVDLQMEVIEALEKNNFMHQRSQYCGFVENYQSAYTRSTSARPEGSL